MSVVQHLNDVIICRFADICFDIGKIELIVSPSFM